MWPAPAPWRTATAFRRRTSPSSPPAPRCWRARGRDDSHARSGTATAQCAAGSQDGSPADPADRAAIAAPCAGCRARRAAGCPRTPALRRCRGWPALRRIRGRSAARTVVPAAGAAQSPRRRCRRRSRARRTPSPSAQRLQRRIGEVHAGAANGASRAAHARRTRDLNRQARPHANESAGSKTRVASSVTNARPWMNGSTAFAGTSGSAVAGRA